MNDKNFIRSENIEIKTHSLTSEKNANGNKHRRFYERL